MVDHVGGTTGRRGTIVELTGFNVWLVDGGRLFRGGGAITIVIRAQGGVLGTYLREVFVGELGVLRGARDHSGVAAVRRGLTAWILDFLFRVCLFDWRLAIFSAAVSTSGLSSVLRGFVGILVSMLSLSMRLGSLVTG